jgi:hypothetical protein
MVFYFITCFQCALQVTLTFQKLIHFTDWVVGHAHLVMFGVFSMWLFGIMTYLFPRLLKRQWYSRKLCEWHFWLRPWADRMAADLTLAGVFQGHTGIASPGSFGRSSQPLILRFRRAGDDIGQGFLCQPLHDVRKSQPGVLVAAAAKNRP